MTTGVRSIGDFCWINMLTPRPEEACSFFADVLGWSYEPIPGMGYTVKAAGCELGGLFDAPPGHRPQIGVMVKVENADATCRRVVELGGQAKPPFDIGGRLRMAVCFDPTGVEFDIWESKGSEGTTIDTRTPGAPAWFEAITPDAARAQAFYGALFGWRFTSAPIADEPGESYVTIEHRGRQIGGLLALTPRMSTPASWTCYFGVADADVAVEAAVRRGAIQGFPVRTVPGVGRFSALASPQGVMFYVLELAR